MAPTTQKVVNRAPAPVAPRPSNPAPAASAPGRTPQSPYSGRMASNIRQPESGRNSGGGGALTTSSEVVDISSGQFSPSEKVKAEIESQGNQGLLVRVIAKGLTEEGQIKVKLDRSQNYDSTGKGSLLLLNDWTRQLGGMYLVFAVKDSQLSGGYASLKPNGGNPNDWLQAVKKNSELLGGLGLQVGNLPAVINKFENGTLTIGVTNLKVVVGGFVDAQFSISVENMQKPKIDATADINIKGAVKGQLKLDNSAETLAGQVSLAVDFKSFSGSVMVTYKADGTIDVAGKAGYNADKLSGSIDFVATDLAAANAFAKSAISAAGGKENVQVAAAPAPVPAPKPGPKQLALAATGQLDFNLTKWFAGKVNVIVDGKGAITVIGKIAPPAEIKLFEQKDWDKELIKFEAKAYYGIPVVGNLNLFANISLHAIAKLGPAKIYNIEILGTYSTDPEVQKSIQISGSINISAYAGLRLRAEGGAGIEILSHDLKFGVGLNADVGVKAYADARPTIGYREPGEFFISGTLDLVAQPVLGLGGDFFIQIETPWWSPLSDDKWVWPLFSKEWPLSDPIGISATVKEYVLGSGKVPEIQLKPPEFDPSKFMTNMVDKTLPEKSSGAGAAQGKFKEDGSIPKPVVPPKKPEKKASSKPPKKGAKPKDGKSKNPDKKAVSEQELGKNLKTAATKLKALKGSPPFSRSELDKALNGIKAQLPGVNFSVKPEGKTWQVSPKASAKAGGKPVSPVILDAKEAKAKKRPPTPFRTEDGENHTLYFEQKGNQVQLIRASDLPTEIVAFLGTLSFPADPEKSQLAQAVKLAGEIQLITRTPSETESATDAKQEAQIVQKVSSLSRLLIKLYGDSVPPVPKVDWSHWNGRTNVPYSKVYYLSSASAKGGSAASGTSPAYEFSSRDKWVRMHLIPYSVGGPGGPENWIPAPIHINSGGPVKSFETTIEAAVRSAAVSGKGMRKRERRTPRPNVIWIEVMAGSPHPLIMDSHSPPRTLTFFGSLNLKSGLYQPDGKMWVKLTAPLSTQSVTIPEPNDKRISLSKSSGTQMSGSGIPHLTHPDYGNRLIQIIKEARGIGFRSDWKVFEARLKERTVNSRLLTPELITLIRSTLEARSKSLKDIIV